MQPRGTSLHRGLEVGKGSVAVFRELDHMNETPISRRDKPGEIPVIMNFHSGSSRNREQVDDRALSYERDPATN